MGSDEDGDEEPPFLREVESVSGFFSSLMINHDVSHRALEAMYEYVKTNGKRCQELAERGYLKSYQHLRKMGEGRIPEIYIETVHLSRTPDGETVRIRKYRQRELEKDKYDKARPDSLYELIHTYVDLLDVMRFMRGIHLRKEDITIHVEVGIDGVEESKNCDYTDVFVGIGFVPCRKPLLWHIFQHLRGDRPDADVIYGAIVDCILDAEAILELLLADGKERKIAKGMVQTRAFYSCDFCLAKGNHIPDPDDPEDHRPENKRGIFYGVKYQYCPRRTEASILEDAAVAAETGNSHGVKKKTQLSRLPGFNYVWKVPFDPMHQMDYGLIKNTLFLFFFKSEAQEVLEMREHLQRVVCSVKVPKEHDRRSTVLEIKTAKTKEFKVIGLFTYLVIARAVLADDQQRQSILLRFCFIYRALMMPEGQYRKVWDALDLQVSRRSFGCYFLSPSLSLPLSLSLFPPLRNSSYAGRETGRSSMRKESPIITCINWCTRSSAGTRSAHCTSRRRRGLRICTVTARGSSGRGPSPPQSRCSNGSTPTRRRCTGARGSAGWSSGPRPTRRQKTRGSGGATRSTRLSMSGGKTTNNCSCAKRPGRALCPLPTSAWTCPGALSAWRNSSRTITWARSTLSLVLRRRRARPSSCQKNTSWPGRKSG